MRILVLNQYFHPDQSATSQLLTELCEDLAEVHDVCVVTGRPSYDPSVPSSSRGLISRERHGDVRVIRVWSTTFHRTSLAGRLANYASYLATSVLGAMSAPRPDVVVALTDPPPIGVVGALVGAVRGVPFVLVTKDIFPDVAVQLGVLDNPALVWALRAISRFLFRQAEAVVSIGRDMTARLVELGLPGSKIRLIYDWADGRAVKPIDGPSPFRAAMGWDGRFVVMHSGNVGLGHALSTVVQAAEILRDDPDVLFVIVGEGAAKRSLVDDCRRRQLTNLSFLPYQPKARLGESLTAADVHLVCMKRGLEGYIVPSKVYGIMAAGRPYIAASGDRTEPALIAAEYGCGSIVEPEDPAALAAAVLAMKAHGSAEMGRLGRAAFVARFDRPLSTDAYRALLEEVVGRRDVIRDRAAQ